MSNYKCISCGNIVESNEPCICPNCGYRMFEMPYDRKVVLRKEIAGFLGKLRPLEIKDYHLSYYRKGSDQQIIDKAEDDDRFPDYEKINGYVCAAQKTEEFCERLSQSISEIRKHITSEYSQSYSVGTDGLLEEIKEFDAVLDEALKELDLSMVVIPEAKLPEISLRYSETPDMDLVNGAGEVLDLLDKMPSKIRRFIKANNIYGTAYKYSPSEKVKLSKDENYAADLSNAHAALEKVFNKTYTVDIFSDGTEELHEILDAVWKAIAVVMKVPILKEHYEYYLYNGGSEPEDDIDQRILNLLARRYSDIEWEISDGDFLQNRSEEELFALYDKMIELDEFGFLGLNKDSLLKIGESEKQLNKLIGLNSIKENIKKIKAYALNNKDSDDLNIHMCFYGNPGSGKTEVARIIAGILFENKILPTKKVVEVDRGGLVGQFVGETPMKTMAKIHEAMGGVLFIDEAYSLVPKEGGRWDYGHEAVATLIKAMEDYRGKFCVILAGYKNEMLEMLASNPGFRSRIQFELDFPNYTREELSKIASLMIKQRSYSIGDAAMNKILDITDIKRKDPNFANAREIRNILDQVIMCQNLRCMGSENKELGLVDVNKYIKDSGINLPTTGEGTQKKLLTGEEELDQLVGLASVKRMVKKIRAYAKKNRNESDFNIHMCFYGNPGTGKTEVARILSRILYDAGVLGEAKVVETDAHGLLGQYVGETAPKTLAKINEAMHGVLFIDEAYGLVGSNTSDGGATSYGEEAIAVLLKEMEDHRGQFCTILAGYKSEMKSMISVNPGLASRIQFTLEFPDYTREELGEIADRFLERKSYEIESDALSKILDITDYFRARPNFANARTVRNILDQVIMNQNLRTEDLTDNKTITIEDVEDYLMDEDIDLSKTGKPEGRSIGFI